MSSLSDPAVIVNVFSLGHDGGNPAPIVLDAVGMTADTMQALAARHGLESAFVFPSTDRRHDLRMRYFVPRREMDVCGHATVGAVWLMQRLGRLPNFADVLHIETLSGTVLARAEPDGAEVSQDRGTWAPVQDGGIVLRTLRISSSDLLPGLPILNARTSRMKTLVPLRSVDILQRMSPAFEEMEATCAAIGSTGLYPFAPLDTRLGRFAARQFPKSSGFPEDAATGVAAAALAWAVVGCFELTSADQITVRQGEAMGRPSEMWVRLETDHCWVGGACYSAST